MSLNLNKIKEIIEESSAYSVSIEDVCLVIKSDDEVEVIATCGETQVIARTLLFPESAVESKSELDDFILQTQHLLPLSSVGITDVLGEKFYMAFGALSVASKDHVLMEEIDTLFANVPEFLEMYMAYLKEQN